MPAIARPLDFSCILILEALDIRGPMTVTDVANDHCVHNRVAATMLKRLVNKGMVVQKGCRTHMVVQKGCRTQWKGPPAPLYALDSNGARILKIHGKLHRHVYLDVEPEPEELVARVRWLLVAGLSWEETASRVGRGQTALRRLLRNG